MRIMIIEDEEIAAAYCAKCIASYGHDISIVAVCRDGDTAREKFSLLNPDVIFADIRLGKDNGLDIISEFRMFDHKINSLRQSGRTACFIQVFV